MIVLKSDFILAYKSLINFNIENISVLIGVLTIGFIALVFILIINLIKVNKLKKELKHFKDK